MKITKDNALNLYYEMRKIRRFEELVKVNNGKNILGPTHLYIGEESIAVGVCNQLRKTDYVTSTHRGHGHTLAKGASINKCFAELYGKKTGYCKGKGGSMHLADFSVGMLGANGVVGGGFNIATGAALAIQLQKRNDVAICFFGDGASSRGTFHEAINFASSMKLPVIFVCENNGWASTTRFSEISSVSKLSKRASGYGIPGITIDGNDLELVINTSEKLIKRARIGEGPSILECITYRIEGHFTSDPQKYRSEIEVKKEFERNDPIQRFKETSLTKFDLSMIDFEQVDKQLEKELLAALEFAKNSPYPSPKEALDDIYEGNVKISE